MRRRFPLLLVVLVVAAASLTGCNRYGYDAHIESVVPGTFAVAVQGWYHDPYLAKRGTLCADIVLTVDGTVLPDGRRCDASLRRTDVERITGRYAFSFQRSASLLAKGQHTACVTVVPPGVDLPATPDHCATFDVPWDEFSQGVIDDANVVDGQLVAGGWYSHVPFTASSGLFRPTWNVDGQWIAAGSPSASVETAVRPDVTASVGPFAIGLRLSMPVASGTHTVCLGLDDGFGGGGPPTICRTVTAA